MLDAAEFDKFAEEYLATHATNIRISGEEPDYFARAKIDEVGRRWAALKSAAPDAILDFGAGIGNTLPFLAEQFPGAAITGLDVSEKSLAIAERRFPGLATLVRYDGGDIPLASQSFDLIFSACVFHHIEAAEHARLFGHLKSLLKPGGLMIVFEHNPVNPVTRYIVATCPFDENAVLIPAAQLKARQRQAGFDDVRVTYTGFFPGALKALRPLEPFMGALPIGAQYYTLAHG
jgi:SAM-dependent methyltransferase